MSEKELKLTEEEQETEIAYFESMSRAEAIERDKTAEALPDRAPRGYGRYVGADPDNPVIPDAALRFLNVRTYALTKNVILI